MISDENRASLINYRIRQSNETVQLAEFLITSNKLVVAVNRIYYGAYYALTALALKYNFETSKHAKLIGWFNKEFVAKNLIDNKHGKFLRIAFQNRTRGDYDAFVEFTKHEVESMLKDLKLFINEIESNL